MSVGRDLAATMLLMPTPFLQDIHIFNTLKRLGLQSGDMSVYAIHCMAYWDAMTFSIEITGSISQLPEGTLGVSN